MKTDEQKTEILVKMNCDCTAKIAGYGQLSYISKKSFSKAYPKGHGGFEVIGAIGSGLHEKIGEMIVSGKSIPYYFLKYKKFFYGIDGYIEVADNVYLAIIRKTFFTNFLKLLLAFLLVLGTSWGIYNYLNNNPELDPGSEKYDAPVKLPEEFEEGRIAIPGYGDMKLKADTDMLYIALWNPDENPCYFKFTISLDKTGESLYTSKLVLPGQAITKVKLNQTFARGIYPITVRIDTFNLKDYKESMNGGEIKTRIVALLEEKKK